MWLLVSLGERSNRPGLVALAWAMMPLHFSSLCACTYHVFYNAPSLAPLVALQAASTAVGNATMAAAAIRLAREPSRAGAEPASGWGVLEFAASWSPEDSALLGKTLAWSVISAAVIKYGSLWLGWPLFGDADGALVSPAPLGVALAVICGGTAATAAALAERCARWTPRSPPPVAEAAVDGAATQQQQQPGA